MACCSEDTPRARVALLICNIILVAIGLACAIGGIVLLAGRQTYGDSMDWMRDLVVREAEKAGFSDVDATALDVKFVTEPLGITFLVVGLFVIGLAVMGIVASSGRFRTLLFVYVISIALLLFAMVIVTTCAYTDSDSFERPAKRMLKDSLKDFTGIAGEDSTTLGWNAVMMHFNCCGVDSYEDFSASTNWVTQIGTVKLTTPAACCLERKENLRCTKRIAFQEQTYYDRGCYNHLFEYVATETGLVIFTTYILVILEVLCLFFSIWVGCVMISKTPDKVAVMEEYY